MAYRQGASEQCGPSSEIDVLWITAGLGCDGDTIAITAATQPSLEEMVMGAIPGIPKINFHNPFLSYENGEDFMEFFYRAAEGKTSSAKSKLNHRVLLRCAPALAARVS